MSRACWAIALTLGVVASVLPARADEVPPGLARFRSFGGAEGLRNLVITSIAQDASGALWVGTDDGVYRYDGLRFTRFGAEEGVLAMPVTALGVAPDGHVCAGSPKGLACWDGARFARRDGLGELGVAALVGHGGRMYAGTAAGLFESDARGVFARTAGWPGHTPVKALWADAHGVIAGDEGRALARDRGTDAWRELRGLAGDRVDGVLRDRRGALWIRTALHLWRFAPGATQPEDLTAGLPAGYDAVGVAVGMANGPRGEVWVATDRGVAYRAGDGWRVIDRAAGLPTVGARTLFVDREGTLWIGSVGLFQWRGRGLIERHDLDTGLPGDIAWSMRRDRDGVLWVGTNSCLARVLDGAWHCLAGTENRIVRTFVFPPQGGVFLGGAPSDLLYIDPDGAPHTLGHELPSLNDHLILALALGPGGDLWLATKIGVYRLPGATLGRLEPVAIPGLSPTARHSSLLYAGGRLWTASSEGLAVLDERGWHVLGAADGLRGTAVQYVARSHDGRVCIGYSEGLGVSCFGWDGRALVAPRHIGVADGMTSGMVYTIGEDRRGRLWLGTGDGIDVVTPTGIDHFTDRDGLAGNDATAMSFLEDPDGSIWMGSTGGLSRIRAADYDGPLPPPRTMLRGGRLGDVAIGDAPPPDLETPHDRNAFTLEFSADSQADADRVEFQVRLAPLEPAWTSTQLRQARYPALPPGSYHFEVRARIGAGAWGPVTSVPFTVRAAWWQRWWFLVLVAVAVLGAIGLAFTWRQRAVLRRRTRQLEEQSDANLRALIEGVPEMISVHRDGVLTYMNRSARRFHGLDDVELPDLEARLHPDDRARVADMMIRALAAPPNTAPEVIEARIRVNDQWRLVEISGVWLSLDGANVLIASGRDVTERQGLRAKLMLSDRMASLGTLAAGVAHEINNPLAYVIGNLQLISEAIADPAREPRELAPAMADALDGAERVRRIVQGLRSFSRSDEERRVPLDVADVLRAAIRMASNEVRHRARLVCELAPVPRVVADDGRLTQVFINLIVNAAHAIPEGHSDANRITVRTRRDDDGRAVIEVEDTGRGMAPDVQARAFDPFFTTKHVGEGSGLGLSICHGIVSGLGGTIALDSAPGRGTTVRVVLPAGPEPAAEAAAPAAPPAPVVAAAAAERRRVLVVDDEPLVAEMLGRALRRDHDVTVVSCGQAALDAITGGAWFDAIVSDVMMPNMTGLELLETLARVAPEQAKRLVFLSGGVFTPETRAALDALGTVQLEKPINAKELREAVMKIASLPVPAPPVARAS